MAAIDKTYVNLAEYNEIREWSKDRIVTYPDGSTEDFYDSTPSWQRHSASHHFRRKRHGT